VSELSASELPPLWHGLRLLSVQFLNREGARIQSASLVFVVKSCIYYTRTCPETRRHRFRYPGVLLAPSPKTAHRIRRLKKTAKPDSGGYGQDRGQLANLNLLVKSAYFCYLLGRV